MPKQNLLTVIFNSVRWAQGDSVTIAILICLLFFLIFIFGVKSYCKRLCLGYCGVTEVGKKYIRERKQKVSHYLNMYFIQVDGAMIQEDKKQLAKIFCREKGFFVKTNLEKRQIKVWSEHKLSEQELRQIMQGAGYPVRSMQREEHPVSP